MSEQLTLSLEEQAELARLETVIAKGLETFFEVGSALLDIREKRLYRQSYSTFADYCRERWTLSARYAHQLIDSVEVVNDLRKCAIAHFETLPQTESVVRPLVNLITEDRQTVWEQSCQKANGHPTAEQVQQTVKEVVPPERRKKRKRKSAAEKIAEQIGGMRIAYDGALVPDDCTDEDRKRHLQELNKLRAERDAKVAEHIKTLPPQPEKAVSEPAPLPKFKVKSFSERDPIEARFRMARSRFMTIMKQHFRPSEYARVCEMLAESITKHKNQ
jgi:predicted Rdx family selenoprotein